MGDSDLVPSGFETTKALSTVLTLEDCNAKDLILFKFPAQVRA